MILFSAVILQKLFKRVAYTKMSTVQDLAVFEHSFLNAAMVVLNGVSTATHTFFDRTSVTGKIAEAAAAAGVKILLRASFSITFRLTGFPMRKQGTCSI